MNDIWVSCQKAPNEDWLDAEKWLLSDHGNIKVPRISLLKWLCPGKPLEQIARFLCLWAHESGSLEDVTNTLKAEAVFLFFWFKARTPTLLAFYWSQLHMIFLFISWLGYKLFFSIFVCVWGGATCACVLVCMPVHIQGGQRNLESGALLLTSKLQESSSPYHLCPVLGF